MTLSFLLQLREIAKVLDPKGNKKPAFASFYTGIQLGFFIICLQVYFWSNLKSMYRMYVEHRLEFRKHICNLTCLHLMTLVALVNMIYASVLWQGIWMCKIEQDKFQGVDLDEDSICVKYLNVKYREADVYSMLSWVQNIILELFPIWSFLLFYKPHDCFRCLGKDPDRIFSSFQLNKAEINSRKMVAKFGSRTTTII